MFASILQTLSAFARTKRAVTAIEYALIAGTIALMILGALTSISGSLSNTFNAVASIL